MQTNYSQTNNPILSIDFKTEYNNVSEVITSTKRACVDMEAIQSGLIKKVGANRLPLLLVILSFMDKDGKAFPSQRKLAELSGQSVNTVNKLINELLEIEVDGQNVLRREIIGKGVKKKSMYYIHQGEVTTTDAVEAGEEQRVKEEIEAVTKTLGTREVASYFAEVYLETFGVGYTFNYGRDLALIKNKLLPNYNDEQLKGLIDVAVTQYKTEWANERYPLPTIPMLCTWLANTAYAKWSQEQAKAQQHEERKKTALALDDSDRFLELL